MKPVTQTQPFLYQKCHHLFLVKMKRKNEVILYLYNHLITTEDLLLPGFLFTVPGESTGLLAESLG